MEQRNDDGSLERGMSHAQDDSLDLLLRRSVLLESRLVKRHQ